MTSNSDNFSLCLFLRLFFCFVFCILFTTTYYRIRIPFLFCYFKLKNVLFVEKRSGYSFLGVYSKVHHSIYMLIIANVSQNHIYVIISLVSNIKSLLFCFRLLLFLFFLFFSWTLDGAFESAKPLKNVWKVMCLYFKWFMLPSLVFLCKSTLNSSSEIMLDYAFVLTK